MCRCIDVQPDADHWGGFKTLLKYTPDKEWGGLGAVWTASDDVVLVKNADYVMSRRRPKPSPAPAGPPEEAGKRSSNEVVNEALDAFQFRLVRDQPAHTMMLNEILNADANRGQCSAHIASCLDNNNYI